MSDIIQKLEEQKESLDASLEPLPKVIDSILLILTSSKDKKELGLCLEILSKIDFSTSDSKWIDMVLPITGSFTLFISAPSSRKILATNEYLRNLFINASITLSDLICYSIIQTPELANDLWPKYHQLKEFILGQWDGKYPFENKPTDSDENLFQQISTKTIILRFIFKVIHLQSSAPPKDPRKRRSATVDTTNLSISMFNSQLSGIDSSVYSKEAEQLVQFVLNLLNGRNVNCQLFSASLFLFIKLIQKRSQFNRKIIDGLLGLNLNSKVPIKKELFTSEDTFLKLKFKLERRNCYRSLKCFIDYLFKHNYLMFVNKKETPGKEADPTSAAYLHKINHILQIQSHERMTKDLLKDLHNDNFNYIYEKALTIKKRRLQNKDGKASFSALYTVASQKPLDFDISTISNPLIIENLVLIAIRNTPSKDLIHSLTEISETYAEITKEEEARAAKRMKVNVAINGDEEEEDEYDPDQVNYESEDIDDTYDPTKLLDDYED